MACRRAGVAAGRPWLSTSPTVTRLTRSQLVRFVEGDLVKPGQQADGYVFRRIDIARLELLCDLSQAFDLDETGLGIVVSLIDQLHAARQDLAILAGVIDALPTELQAQIMAELKKSWVDSNWAEDRCPGGLNRSAQQLFEGGCDGKTQAKI
jgi:chaperone modulatory protein CbpM